MKTKKHIGRKLIFLPAVLICFLSFPHFLFAQCNEPPDKWMLLLTQLENSDSEVEERINDGEILMQNYKRCNASGDSIYARMLHRVGSFYSEKGALEKAIEYTKRAVEINKKDDAGSEKAYLVNSYFNLGVYYNYLSLFPQSISFFDNVIEVSKSFPEKEFLALMAMQQKAYSYFLIGDYKKSIDIADNGALLAEKTADDLAKALLLIQKAQSSLHLNQISMSENAVLSSIDILTTKDFSKEYLASAFNVYAKVLAKKQLYDEAISYLNRSLALNKEIGNKGQYIGDLMDLGALYGNELNKMDKAIEVNLLALQISDPLHEPYQVSGIYNNIGQAYWKLHQYEKSLYYYQKGLNSLPINFNDTSIYANPSQTQLKLVAQDNYVRQVLRNKGEAFLDLYKVTEKKEILKHSLNAHKAADFMIDQMRQKQQQEESKEYWRQIAHEVYKNAIETSYLLNDAENAFFFLEKSKAVLLNDKLKELNAWHFLTQEEQLKEQEFHLTLNALQRSLTINKNDREKSIEIQERLYNTREEFDMFIHKLGQTNPVYHQYKFNYKVPTIEEVQTRIPTGDQTFLAYFTTADHVYVLGIDPEKSFIDRIALPEFNSMIRDLNYICSNRALLNQNYSKYTTLAHKVYKSIFEPFQIETKRVVVSPDEQFIPFELLLTLQNDPASFLLNDHIFSYTYSATTLLNTRDHSDPENVNLLGIAPVEFSNHLKKADLHGADKSLDKISSYFNSSNLLVKSSATKNDFLKNLPSYSVVQLYSHVDADTSGKEPRLYFYDSALYINEIQNFKNSKTNLIILAACRTGVGRVVKGEGVFSLSRGFAAAGIPSTITNLWEIENHSTYLITELFYKYLHEGSRSDEALQKAKLEFLKISDKEQQLPYFWASSILIGQQHVLKATETTPVYFIFFTSALLLTILVVLIKVFKKSTK